MDATPTRRQLLAGGLGAAAGATLLVPSSADAASQGGSSPTGGASDRQILEQLLAAERLLEYGYEQALASGYLKPESANLALLFLAHEESHTAALRVRLASLRPTGRPEPGQTRQPAGFPPPEVADLFRAAASESDVLAAIVEIENLAESRYFTAAGGFADPGLVRLAAEILACEAQHWTLLVDLLHRGSSTRAVPHPFVRGSKNIGAPHT